MKTVASILESNSLSLSVIVHLNPPKILPEDIMLGLQRTNLAIPKNYVRLHFLPRRARGSERHFPNGAAGRSE